MIQLKRWFNITNPAESKRHQNHFFQLGYFWASAPGSRTYRHLYGSTLLLASDLMNITYQTSPANTHTGQECKLLHPKQKDFLIHLLANPHGTRDYDSKFKQKIDSIIEDGYYSVMDSDWLNEILKFKTIKR